MPHEWTMRARPLMALSSGGASVHEPFEPERTFSHAHLVQMTTGFPEPDAAADFARERRRQSLAMLASRLRVGRHTGAPMLRFDQVVGALGRASEHDVGMRSIALASIVGTVDRRSDDFDRLFRPRTDRLRSRWQRIAAARRRGETMPPIDVYRVGELHFVIDGHHRVSVARAQGDATIDAHIREVQTTAPATDACVPHRGSGEPPRCPCAP